MLLPRAELRVQQFSSARMAVMIFVVEAIGSISSAFCANNTRPLSASISTAAFASTVNGSDARECQIPIVHRE